MARSSSAARKRNTAPAPAGATRARKSRAKPSGSSTAGLAARAIAVVAAAVGATYAYELLGKETKQTVEATATGLLEAAQANQVVVGLAASTAVFALLSVYLWAAPRGGIVKALKNSVGGALVVLPGVKGLVDKEMGKMMADLEKSIIGDLPEKDRIREMPAKGMTADRMLATIEAAAAKDKSHWSCGKLSGTVYHGGDELSTIISSAIAKFALSNPLHPSSFPSVRKMDAEVVAMTASLFHPTDTTCGTTTSGGTESILLACYACRERARKERGVVDPEMILPVSAHAAFNKGAYYFGIKVVSVPVDPVTFRVDPEDVRAAVTGNTVMIVGSAPQFPQGVVDPIPELAAIAKSCKAGMHVDCCLGSLMIPFARSIGGRDVPDFDFAVDGVTSISCDTHKYGFAPKGSSVIMWADSAWRRYQYFAMTSWTGGIYATPTLAGSRAGANLAATWAVLVHMGLDGYKKAAERVFAGADIISTAIAAMPELEQHGTTDHAVVAFGPRAGAENAVNVYKVAEAMAARGWELNSLQHPASVHICVTYANAPFAETFVEDLTESVAEVVADPGKYKSGAAAMYGASTAMAPESMLEDVAGMYLDTMYKA